MPEGIEVCLTSMWLNYNLKNTKLVEVKMVGGRYIKKGFPGCDVLKKSLGGTVVEVSSKGKMMWFALRDQGNETYIISRFGLSGKWTTQKEKYAKVMFTFKNGKHVLKYYYDDMISYGTLAYVPKENFEKEYFKLGIDALKDEYTWREIYKKLGEILYKDDKQRAIANSEIIKLLMDQQLLFCGIGNYLVAEILYDCKISPHTKIITIYENKKLLKKLCHSIKYITKLSFISSYDGYNEYIDRDMTDFIRKIRKNIFKNPKDVFNYQPTIKISPQEKFIFKVYSQETDPQKNIVTREKIVGDRIAHWVPKIQIKY